MDEAEWLTSADPSAMLAHLLQGAVVRRERPGSHPAYNRGRLPGVTDGKLRAVCRALMPQWPTPEDYPSSPAHWLAGWCSSCDHAAKVRTCALLRCVFGNPFRPVALATDWLTPLVRQLAQAAEAGECGRCGGRKCVSSTLDDDGFSRATVTDTCHDCGGTGRAAGLLEADRLGVLADGLEESGCPVTVECPECEGHWLDIVGQASVYDHAEKVWKACPRCAGTGRVQNALLGHLRGAGPHCAVCFAVSAILGRE